MIDLSGLNQAQYEAVTSTSDKILCLAGAGTGKTRVLTHRIARLCNEGVSCQNMVALTFTRLAGTEMKERVIHLIGASHGRELFCNTFHAFCAEILQENAHYIGFDKDFSIYDPFEQEAVVKDILNDFDYKNMSLKRALASIKGEPVKGSKEYLLNKEYYFRMQQNNAIDFDSLIQFTIRLFQEYPGVKKSYQNRYKHVFIDEFQDTSDDQWELITLLQPVNLFIVGDDFQGIYGWRSANINIILQLAEDTSYQTIKLEENYRSTMPIIAAANTLIKKNKQTEKVLRTEKCGKPIITTHHNSVQDELLYVKEMIVELVATGQCDYKDIAVLARTNGQLEAADMALADIPRVVVNAIRDPLKNEDVKTVLTFIESVRNSSNESLIRKLIRKAKPAFTEKETLQIERYQLQTGASFLESINQLRTPATTKFIEIYEKINSIVQQNEFDPLIVFFGITSVVFDMDYPTENIEKAEHVIKNWMTRQQAIEEPFNIGAMLQWLRLRDIQDRFSEATDDVKLMTVHASKGLEFDTVFIIGMNQGVFPSKGDIEEERRLFYVAITRAKNNLFISRSNTIPNWSGKEVATEESRFLQEILS